MKSTIVPAQITTIEDKIAGNLNITQLFLLAAPFFIGSAVYVILPPFFESSEFKIVVIGMILCTFPSLAIRVHERIILGWIAVLAKYYLKPRYYVPTATSETYSDLKTFEREDQRPKIENSQANSIVAKSHLTIPDLVRTEQLVEEKLWNVRYKVNKKGILNVFITVRK